MISSFPSPFIWRYKKYIQMKYQTLRMWDVDLCNKEHRDKQDRLDKRDTCIYTENTIFDIFTVTRCSNDTAFSDTTLPQWTHERKVNEDEEFIGKMVLNSL